MTLKYLGAWLAAFLAVGQLVSAVGTVGSVPPRPISENGAAIAPTSLESQAAALLESDPRRTRELARQALVVAERAGDLPAQIRLLNLLGRASDFASDYPEAVHYYQNGITLAEQTGDTAAQILLNQRLGIIYALTGDKDEGLRLCLKALELADSTHDALGRSQALGQTGLVYILRKEYEPALDYMTRALEAKRALSLTSEVAGALNNLGVIYRNLGRFDEALSQFQESLAIQLQANEPKSLAATYSYLGKVYANLDDVDQSLDSHLKALRLRESIGDLRGESSTLLDIAELYRSAGKFESAVDYYERTLSMREQVLSAESQQRIDELRTRFQVRQKEQENQFLRQRSRLERTGLLLLLGLVLAAGLFLYLRIQSRAQANARALAIQRTRNGILQMNSAEEWPGLVEIFRQNLAGLVRFDRGGLIRREPDGATAYLFAAGETTERRMLDLPPFLDRAFAANEPLRIKDAVRVGEWAPLINSQATSLLAVPFHEGLVALGRNHRPCFSRREEQTVSRFAALMSEASRRLGDLETLGYKRRQLELSRRMETLGNFTTGIAHHFNNLLQAILGNADLALAQSDASAAPLLEEIRRAGSRAAALVEQLLVFSKRNAPAPHTSVDLILCLSRVLVSDSRLRVPGIRIERRFRSQQIVSGNSAQLERLFSNLIANAFEALVSSQHPHPQVVITVDRMDSPRHLHLEGTESKPFCAVEIADNGPGLPPEIIHQVFDPFFTTRGPKSAGLGLSAARSLAEQHGGTLVLTSTPGKGTTARVLLPTIN